MKILFVCGSVEPGKDGVGDYTRRLAGECIRQGNDAWILSFCDRYINGAIKTIQLDEEQSINCLRLPFKNSRYLNEAKNWIKEINPDLLSLQYVPFSFHDKGLDFSLHTKLLKISNGLSWHIMFHELWVGLEKGASMKTRIIGGVQRYLLNKLVKNLRPVMMHTQTEYYKIFLKSVGLKVKVLPLFSNVTFGKLFLNEIKSVQNGNILQMVFFGSIHPGGPIEAFTNEVAQYAREKKTEISFVFIGRNGKERDKWINAALKQGFKVEDMGEQAPQTITNVLQKSNLGLSTTPIYLMGKSGSVAAMRQFELPIICISGPWGSKRDVVVNLPKDVLRFKTGNFHKFVQLKPDPGLKGNLREIAKQFITEVSC